MVIYTDPQTGEYLWACPECGTFIRFHSLLAVQMAKQAGGCQGCRARIILSQTPVLINAFLDFWTRTGAWPQSPSWMEALPVTA
jgi:hypothetical protein